MVTLRFPVRRVELPLKVKILYNYNKALSKVISYNGGYSKYIFESSQRKPLENKINKVSKDAVFGKIPFYIKKQLSLYSGDFISDGDIEKITNTHGSPKINLKGVNKVLIFKITEYGYRGGHAYIKISVKYIDKSINSVTWSYQGGGSKAKQTFFNSGMTTEKFSVLYNQILDEFFNEFFLSLKSEFLNKDIY